LLAAALVLGIAGAAAAQFAGGFGFGPRFVPARFPDADTFGHGFVFCRGVFRSDRREAGGTGWSTDYPDAELNFSIRLSELTKTRINRGADGKPVHVTVRLTDDALFKCPYLHMEDVGTVTFSEREIDALRAYLLKGGFLWVDDFWGSQAWAQFTAQIHKALPETRIYVMSIKPSVLRWANWPEAVKANNMLKALVAKNPRLTYIDVATPFLQPNGQVMTDIFVPDNLHLNEKGYKIWTEAVRAVLIPAEGRYERSTSN
jgi:hypothetical protein